MADALRDVQIDLRRADVRVPEQLLQRAYVGASLQQMRSETVPQTMRRHAFFDARLFHRLGDVSPIDFFMQVMPTSNS